MDDEEQYGMEEDSDPDSLSLGERVIVHTDDGYEPGILLSAGENGVRLRVTHRVENLAPALSKAEKMGVEAVVAGMNRRDLLVCAWEIMGVKAVLMTRKTAEEMVVEDLCENMLAQKNGAAVLKPLTRTVNTFMPWSSVVKIVSHTEWEEEQLLRPFEASLAEKADG